MWQWCQTLRIKSINQKRSNQNVLFDFQNSFNKRVIWVQELTQVQGDLPEQTDVRLWRSGGQMVLRVAERADGGQDTVLTDAQVHQRLSQVRQTRLWSKT